ncbi:hypothetical protein SRHO_G00325410 [Serrasalmus rhombeus]
MDTQARTYGKPDGSCAFAFRKISAALTSFHVVPGAKAGSSSPDGPGSCGATASTHQDELACRGLTKLCWTAALRCTSMRRQKVICLSIYKNRSPYIFSTKWSSR